MAIINFPILYIPDPSIGRPLFGGKIYVGNPDTDPTIPANQKQLRVVQENGSLVNVSQPLVLSSGGVPTYNGSPVRLDVAGNYSIKILSRLNAQVFYIPNVFEGAPVTEEDLPEILNEFVSAEFATVSALLSGTTLNGIDVNFSKYVGRNVSTVVHNTTSNEGGATYTITNVNPGNLATLISGIWVGANLDLGGGFYAKLSSTPTMQNVGASFSGDQIAALTALHAVSSRIESSSDFDIGTQYTASTPIEFVGSYKITAIANMDCVIRADDELIWGGVVPEVASGVALSKCFVFSTNKLPKFYNFEIGELRGNDFFESSGSFSSSDVLTLEGDFVCEDVTMKAGSTSSHLFKVVGGSDWSTTSATAPTARFTNCRLRGDQFYYTAKGFRLVDVDGCEFEHDKYRDYIHNWYSQDTGLLNFTAETNATITGGTVVTTAATVGITSDASDTLTIGKKYRLSLSVKINSGTTFRVYENNASGALLASGLSTGVYNIEFTAATNCRIYVRFDAASDADFEMFQALQDPTTDAKGSATFDTLTHRVTNSVFRGGERGPTAGIDTLNTDFRGNKVFDAWVRAIALDTERFSPPAWDSAYPKSRAIIADNETYNCGRFIYSTCRSAKISNNIGNNCAISGSFTGTPAAMRFNSDDWGYNDWSEIVINDNLMLGCGSNTFISCDADHRIVQYGNIHDSKSSYPVKALKGVYRYPPAALAPKTASFTLDPSMPFVYVQYATTGTFLEISVPNDDNLVALGYEYTVVFVGTIGDVRLKAQTGDSTINGLQLLTVPTSTKMLKVVNTNAACDHRAIFLT